MRAAQMASPVHTVRLRQDTLTLKYPCLQTLCDAVRDLPHSQPSLVELGYFKLSGKVRGLQIVQTPGRRAAVDRFWHVQRDHLTICDGTIELPGSCNIVITGKDVTLRNVIITGRGKAGHRQQEPCLVHITAGAKVTFDQCIVECDRAGARAVLIDKDSTCIIHGTRIYGCGAGTALKVCHGTASISKRSLLQGGIMVTSGQRRHGSQNISALELSSQQTHHQQQTTADGAISKNNITELQFEDNVATVDVEANATDNTTMLALEAFENQPCDEQTASGGTQTKQEYTSVAANNVTGVAQNEGVQPLLHSHVEIKNSEVLAGPAACITVHGSRSSVVCDGSRISGVCNFGVLASHGARVKLTGSEVEGTSTAAADITSGAQLQATATTFSASLLGVRVERGAHTHLTNCKINSIQVPDGNPLPMPAAPKPGFLSCFSSGVAAPLEVRGSESTALCEDCVFGVKGVEGWRELSGGQVVSHQGLGKAMKPLNQLTAKAF